MSNKLESLAKKLTAAKAAEAAAKDVRIGIEAEIYTEAKSQGVIPQRGTVTAGPIKISVGLTENWSQAKLVALAKEVPAEQFPFKSEFKCDKKALNKLAVDHPDTYRKIFPALTTKPKKPAFTVVENDSE